LSAGELLDTEDSIKIHDQEAAAYDRQVKEYEWHGHDVIFGMCHEYMQAGDRLLDLGIGTGLASLPFAGVGVEIYGIDGSAEMLKICRTKNMAKELRQFDLRNTPFPYTDHLFDHIICCGVLHFFGELKPIFAETARIIKPGGLFTYIIVSPVEGDEDYSSRMVGGGIVFMHKREYIAKLLRDCRFEKLKELTMMSKTGAADVPELRYGVYVTRRCSE
jgi:predicted TPR repeat methyltransferase